MKPLRLTLTARLTVLFTLVAASVLLGLGVLVAWATARHFVELDRIFLDDKVHLVEKLVAEAASPAALTGALDDMLDSHKGLFVQVWLGGDLIYGQQALTQNLPADSLASGRLMEWSHAGQALRGVIENLPLPAASPLASTADRRTLRVLVALDTAHHTHFLADLRKTLAAYLLVATLVSGVLGWWAARRGLAPLKAMRDRATAVTSHTSQERMPVASVPVEFAELAGLSTFIGFFLRSGS